jgi:hypothetical protein
MSANILVGGKEQIYACSFCVRDDTDAEFTVPVGKGLGVTPLKFIVRFEPGESGGAPMAGWEKNVDGVVKFTFRGWTALGAVTEPVRIGDSDGVGLHIQLAHQRVGATNHVNWYVLMGGS